MPPKAKFTRQEIVDAAVEIVRSTINIFARAVIDDFALLRYNCCAIFVAQQL